MSRMVILSEDELNEIVRDKRFSVISWVREAHLLNPEADLNSIADAAELWVAEDYTSYRHSLTAVEEEQPGDDVEIEPEENAEEGLASESPAEPQLDLSDDDDFVAVEDSPESLELTYDERGYKDDEEPEVIEPGELETPSASPAPAFPPVRPKFDARAILQEAKRIDSRK